MSRMSLEYNRIKQREWRERLAANPEEHEKYKAKKRAHWKSYNPPKRTKEERNRYSKNLTNAYVAMTMCVSVKNVPVELLEVKRKILTLKRTLKEIANNE